MKKYLLLLLFLKHSSFPYVKIEKAIILAAAQYVLSSCYIDESFTQTQKICQNFGLSINPKTSLWKIQSNKYFQNEITPIFKEAFSIINENKELSVNEYHKTQSTGITKYFYNIKNIASNFLGTSEKTIDKELKKRIVDFCNISNIENREKITDTKTIEKYASENHSISLFSSESKSGNTFGYLLSLNEIDLKKHANDLMIQDFQKARYPHIKTSDLLKIYDNYLADKKEFNNNKGMIVPITSVMLANNNSDNRSKDFYLLHKIASAEQYASKLQNIYPLAIELERYIDENKEKGIELSRQSLEEILKSNEKLSTKIWAYAHSSEYQTIRSTIQEVLKTIKEPSHIIKNIGLVCVSLGLSIALVYGIFSLFGNKKNTVTQNKQDNL